MDKNKKTTEEPKKELNKKAHIQVEEDEETSYGYNPEDYGMCLSQWGWM